MKQETQQQTASTTTSQKVVSQQAQKVICIGNRQTQRIWWLRFS